MTQIKVSKEVQDQAMKVAKATQKPGQTKEQTKLIAQGIEKGIAEYKKQQKKLSRERDKAKKQELKAKAERVDTELNDKASKGSVTGNNSALPWALLMLSWLGFMIFNGLN